MLDLTINELKNLLQARLSAKRFQHSLNTGDVAKKLALQHGADADKAYLAGLLHDYAKGISAEKLWEIASAQGLIQDEIEKQIPDILHAPVGAYLLAQELNIKDNELLQAVRYHTLGAMEMSLLDKIIYIADIIEPGRDFPGLQRLYCLAFKNIDQALIFSMESTIRYCLEKQRLIHPLSVKNRNHLLQIIKKSNP